MGVITAMKSRSPLKHFLKRDEAHTVKIFCSLWIILALPPALPLQAEDIPSLLKEGDRLWEQRMDKESFNASLLLYKKALQLDPENYEVNWRISRSYFWLGDQLGESEGEGHKSLGEEGMQYGKAAIQQNPAGVEGHYYYAITLGQYGLGISIVKALIQGLGSEYEEHLKMVLKLDRGHDHGGALRAMGRYYYKLPWPKRDLKKSIEYLKEAVCIAPWNCRGHVYLAESYLKSGEKDPARAELMTAIRAEGNPEIEVDQQRWKETARMTLKKEFPEKK